MGIGYRGTILTRADPINPENILSKLYPIIHARVIIG